MTTQLAPPTPAAPDPGPAETGAPTGRARHRSAAPPGRRRRWVIGGVLVVVLVLLAGEVGLRLTATPAPATVSATVDAEATVPGAAPTVPWPTVGQAAVAVPALGWSEQSGAETPVPVASMTKLMTALIVLTDHPLSLTSNGPKVTMTAADAADYDGDVAGNDASLPVKAGEVLTERQLLNGLLVRSADNFADVLATWDAGSVPAFVAKMNAGATLLGMDQSHFADPSGVSPDSVSTAADLLKAASTAMADPAFAALVDQTSTSLPMAPDQASFTPLIGQEGVVGVKSGWTTAAGGGDVMALKVPVDGRTEIVLAAVTSQPDPDPLGAAGQADLRMARAVGSALAPRPVVRADQQVAVAAAGGHRIAVVTTGDASFIGLPGQVVSQRVLVTHGLAAGAPAGSSVGVMRVRLGDQTATVGLRTVAAVPRPGLVQRLL